MTSSTSSTGPSLLARLGRINREVLLLDVILLGAGGYMLLQALQLGATPRRAPIWVLTAMLALVLLDIATSVVHALRDEMYLEEHTDRIVAPLVVQLGYLSALVAAGALMYVFGYRVATPIFLAGFLLFMRVPLRILIPFVALFSGFVYVVFSELLNVR